MGSRDGGTVRSYCCCFGLGSDFDGAVMPLGMEDVSKLPKITDALLRKGYSDQDIQKILGGNILRVMEAVAT